MKRLKAEKCKDGWYISLTTNYVLPSEQDVYKLIKQEGMQVRTIIRSVEKDGEQNGDVKEINAD